MKTFSLFNDVLYNFAPLAINIFTSLIYMEFVIKKGTGERFELKICYINEKVCDFRNPRNGNSKLLLIHM